MKKSLILAALGITASVATSYGTGYIHFENYDCSSGAYYAATNVPAGTAGLALRSGFTASLYWAIGDVSEPSISDATAVPVALQLLPDQGGPSQTSYPTIFMDLGNNCGFDGFFGFPSCSFNPPITLPGYTSGPVTFEIVMWANSGPYGGSSYATSRLRGHSVRIVMPSIATSAGSAGYIEDFSFPRQYVQLACTNPPPQITQQPTNQIVAAGGNATFSVTVVSDFPSVYQWRFNGTNIPGATSNPLVLTNVQASKSGLYSVAVSACTSVVVSSNASLTVLTAPVITAQPQGTVGYWGGSAQFDVAAEGVPAPTYLWYKENFPISWATNSTLVLTNLQFSDAAHYSVVVSNSQGSVPSSSALLVVNAAGVTIGLHPFLTITGTEGNNYGIQYTLNVSDTNSWITLTNFTLTQPIQEWVDSGVDTTKGNNPKRFYRVVAIP